MIDLSPIKMPSDARLVTGIDLVQISRIEQSLVTFGDRFIQRLFREGEAAYAERSPALRAERLAARFAAKEATIKAFDLSEAGINLRDIEVVRRESGACALVLHGSVAQLIQQKGFDEIALSMSHDGDYAVAIVCARRAAESVFTASPSSVSSSSPVMSDPTISSVSVPPSRSISSKQ